MTRNIITMQRRLVLVVALAVIVVFLDRSSSNVHALAGVVRRVRSIGIWGKLSEGRTYSTNNINYYHVAPSSVITTTSSSKTLSIIDDDDTRMVGTAATAASAAILAFDADSYRRQMTDLVYQRGLSRLNSS